MGKHQNKFLVQELEAKSVSKRILSCKAGLLLSSNDNQKMAEQSAVERLGLRTAPFDARFPNQNQTKNCWQNFMDYQRCIKNKGEEYEPCNYFYKNFKSICPVAWVEKWNEQLENGTFAGKI